MTRQPRTATAIRAYSHRLQKRGNEVSECEDACAVKEKRGRFAIADGAAESGNAGQWARLLVDAYVRLEEKQPAWASWLPAVQQQWIEAARPAPDAELPWYLDGRYEQGAFATFVGVSVDSTHWHVQAVGDSCLFVVRGDQLLEKLPLTHSSQFTNTPWLLGSRTSMEVARQHGCCKFGAYAPGDQLWLLTDALARWFLEQDEEKQRPWQQLLPLLQGNDEEFADWVEERRTSRALRNDDTTVVGVLL